MDRRNGGDPLAPPRPPKLLPRVHRPRAAEPPMMSAPLSPIQQQQQLCTNIHLHPQQQNHQSNNNNNIINIRNSSNSSNSSSLVRNSNSNNNNNSINSNSDVISIHPVPITAPLIPLQLQQQQQTFNISNNSLSSTTITSTNSFTRRRPPPPILTNNNATLTLLPSISSNIIHNLEAPVSPVTLAAPRPESERLANEYVDTPFRSQQQQQQHLLHQTSRTQHPAGQTIHGQTTTQHNLLLLQQNQRRQLQQQHQHQQQHSHPSYNQHSSNAIISGTNTSLSQSGSGGGGGGTSTLLHSNISSSHKGNSNTTTSLGTAQTTASTTTLLLPGQTPRHHLQSQQPVSRPTVLPIASAITKQPVAFSKDVPASILHDDLDMHHTGTNLGADSPNSITCPQCKRCRCEQCQSPRKLPSRWVCNKTCLCSAEAVIDYASCLCCVKALFYHCAKDHEMEGDDGDIISCADDPCSCLPHKRAARWGWLGALSVALPCLWCYWPMRGCVALCAKCYARHYRNGCRCQSIGSTSILSTTSTTGNNTIGNAKSADGGGRGGVGGGGVGHHLNNHSNSGITGGNHHHHHSSGGAGGGGGRTIIRTSDLTPEKRLLDSSPEY